MSKSTLLLTAISLSFASGSAVLATTIPHAPPAHIKAQQQLPPSTMHKFRGTVLNSGGFNNATSGFTTLDTETASCSSKTGSCTLALSGTAVLCNQTSGTDLVYMLIYVDSYFEAESEDSVGPYGCATANAQGTAAVGPGSYSVMIQTYSSYSEYISNWSDRTDITTP